MPYIVIVLDIVLIVPLHYTPACLVQDFTNVVSSSTGISVFFFFQKELVFRKVTTIRKVSVKAFSHENRQLFLWPVSHLFCRFSSRRGLCVEPSVDLKLAPRTFP